jgi:hypothetical protein
MRFESHLGHSVSAGQRPNGALIVYKSPKSVDSGIAFFLWPAFESAQKKDGTTSFMVCWRDPASSKEQGITFANEAEAVTLMRLLDANKQSFEIAQ